MSLLYRFSTFKAFLKPTFSTVLNTILLKNNISSEKCKFYSTSSPILYAKSENTINSVSSSQDNKILKEPQGSYLEEVLLKHKEKPQNAAQKGMIYKRTMKNSFFKNKILFSEKRC